MWRVDVERVDVERLQPWVEATTEVDKEKSPQRAETIKGVYVDQESPDATPVEVAKDVEVER